MNGPTRNTLRHLSRIMRRHALKYAGQKGATASVIHHRGRKTGRLYATPVEVGWDDDAFLIALPYGPKTDWLRNVLEAGSAAIKAEGEMYIVERPEVIPISEATDYFRTKGQSMHRRFGVKTALRVHRVTSDKQRSEQV